VTGSGGSERSRYRGVGSRLGKPVLSSHRDKNTCRRLNVMERYGIEDRDSVKELVI
jgi:hypothetical protein